jgi:hypothetical protein
MRKTNLRSSIRFDVWYIDSGTNQWTTHGDFTALSLPAAVALAKLIRSGGTRTHIDSYDTVEDQFAVGDLVNFLYWASPWGTPRMVVGVVLEVAPAGVTVRGPDENDITLLHEELRRHVV